MLGLVLLCYVYFLFVVVWLSVSVQSVAWKDVSLKWPTMCSLGHKTLHKNSLTLITIITVDFVSILHSKSGDACINKSAQSNLARGLRRGAVAHVRPIGPCGQWRASNSPPKVPLPVDRSSNPTTCLIPGPVRPTMPSGIQIRSAILSQCTGQTD